MGSLAAGLRDAVKVMVGGAPVTQAYADNARSYYENELASLNIAARMKRDYLEELDEAGERPTLRELHLITSDGQDRFGITKKSTNVNVNVDFAAKLEAAIARSKEVAK